MKLVLILLFPILSVAQFKHVYGHERLRLIAKTKQITGVVTRVIREGDGDIHIKVKLQDSSTIVCECICQYKTTEEKAEEACAGYKKKFAKVRVGQKVQATGAYCYDINHGWYEIHPVTKLIIK